MKNYYETKTVSVELVFLCSFLFLTLIDFGGGGSGCHLGSHSPNIGKKGFRNLCAVSIFWGPRAGRG